MPVGHPRVGLINPRVAQDQGTGQLELQHLCLQPATAAMALSPGLAPVSDQESRGCQDGPCLLKASPATSLSSCFLLSLGEASHWAKDQGPTSLAGLLGKLTPVTLPKPPVLTGPPALIRPVCRLPIHPSPFIPLHVALPGWEAPSRGVAA